MEKYDDRPISEINWTKYKIIVPTEKDKLIEMYEQIKKK